MRLRPPAARERLPHISFVLLGRTNKVIYLNKSNKCMQFQQTNTQNKHLLGIDLLTGNPNVPAIEGMQPPLHPLYI